MRANSIPFFNPSMPTRSKHMVHLLSYPLHSICMVSCLGQYPLFIVTLCDAGLKWALHFHIVFLTFTLQGVQWYGVPPRLFLLSVSDSPIFIFINHSFNKIIYHVIFYCSCDFFQAFHVSGNLPIGSYNLLLHSLLSFLFIIFHTVLRHCYGQNFV